MFVVLDFLLYGNIESAQNASLIMHPLLHQLAAKFDRLAEHDELLDAIAELEDVYDALSEIEQEAAGQLLEELHRRLDRARD